VERQWDLAFHSLGGSCFAASSCFILSADSCGLAFLRHPLVPRFSASAVCALACCRKRAMVWPVSSAASLVVIHSVGLKISVTR